MSDKVVLPGEGQSVRLDGIGVVFKLFGADTGGSFALIGERVIQAQPGTLIAKPRGVMHTFWNAGSQPARVLEIIAPAGFEQYFVELGELVPVGSPKWWGPTI